MSIMKRLLLSLTRRGDLALAVLLGIVVFLMILPMPTLLVDTFIAINIAVAIALLMIGVYVPTPLAFSTLPSVLLLSTLFRLALTITTTRLILSQADAGEIVYAFGDFVVAGNLVVGVVVFLIITIVQFIVITKGAERVAEVCARFSLDGMPGKQMSIDADLRAGVIDTAEAVNRRARLEQQSQLYGSMDGAMKFVKGDAIAGLCIIAVNIIGGIATGVFQHEMSLGDAVAVYTTLTIGDGLVGQIPALFIAITAGIIVTRVTSDNTQNNLGSDIAEQVLAQPNALLVAGAACFGLALLPGFPVLVFLIFGVLIGGVGLTLKSAERERRDVSGLMTEGAKAPAATGGGAATAPLSLTLPAAYGDAVGLRSLNAELEKVREAFFASHGLPFPKIHLRPCKSLTDGAGFSIDLHGVPVVTGDLPEGCYYYADDACSLNMLGIEHNVTPTLSGEGAWLDEASMLALRNMGVACQTHTEYLAARLGNVCEQHAIELFGLQEVKSLLDAMQRECPDVVKEVNRVVTLQQLTQVLKCLVTERVNIRDLPLILETLADAGRNEKDPALLAECVRLQLRRQICHALGGDTGTLAVLMLSAETESSIRQRLQQQGEEAPGLQMDLKRRLIDALEACCGRSGPGRRTIVLTSADLRRRVHGLLARDFENASVISYRELVSDWPVQPLGEIRLA